MYDKLARVAERYEELNQLMADPDVATDPDKLRVYAVEQAEIAEVAAAYRRYEGIVQELEETRAMLDGDQGLDEEMSALVQEEVERLQRLQEEMEERLTFLLLPRDPNDERNVIVEIRAGAGGDEAGLFAADLFRMYTRFAENQGWKVDVISANDTGVGGFKEVIFEVRGRGAYSRLKYESGVHRVQRVPVTESSGRIHTSTATVIVLPEVEEVEVEIDPNDLRIDVFRAGGHGGQSVNTTDSAVRLTHLPTGIVVTCQDEKSQLQNKLKAMRVLRARLHEMEEERRSQELGEVRRGQIGTGERSEKIRTYNFPQSRVTDHRIGLTVHQLDSVLDGAIEEFVEALATADQSARLAELNAA